MLPSLPSSELAPWRSARTVADLGELMADWLEGRIPASPGYCDTRPEDETRHLIPTLAACNRSGYITTNSQPGEQPVRGVDGRMWRQRAVVDGWIANPALLHRIRTTAATAGITVITNRPGRRPHPGMIVTEADGEAITDYGWSPGHRRLIAYQWPGIPGAARRELRTATHLTLVDPAWGRDDRLWPLLADTVAAHADASCAECGAPYLATATGGHQVHREECDQF
jgi:hypothetical protein